MADPRRYRFGPLERRGALLGLQASQVVGVVASLLLAWVALRLFPGRLGVGAAFLVVVTGGVASCWPWAGRPVAGWAALAAGWVRRIKGGPRLGVQAGARTGRTAPSLLRLIELAPEAGDGPLGVVRDLAAGTWAGVVPVYGRSFSLLDAAEKERRLAAWGGLLSALARSGSPVHRVQWLQRAAPGDSRALVGYLHDALRALPGPALDSYADLIRGAGSGSAEHETLVVLSIRPKRSGRAARAGERPGELLRRELRLLSGQLRNADLVSAPPLDLASLRHCLRRGYDPATRAGDGGAADGTAGPEAARTGVPWPMASEEKWSMLHTDGAWHTTYWVAEWPRLEVGPDFLVPLLLTGGCRAISVTLEPVPPDRATRDAESASTAELADGELRRKAGFTETARRHREAEGVARRETELADGHADCRFSGYVSVTATDEAALEGACAEVEQAALQAHLRLRRLYGQQAEAFTWALPLARGLR